MVNLAVVGVLLFALIVLRGGIRLGIGDLLILLGMAAYYWIKEEEFLDGLDYGLRYFAVFQVGKYLGSPWDNKDSSKGTSDNDFVDWVAFVILILGMSLFCKALLNFSYLLTDTTVLHEGEWPRWSWKLPVWDWSMEVFPLGDSAHQFYLVLIGSMLFYFVMMMRKNKLLGITGSVLAICSIALGAIVRGRLGFVCSMGVLAISLIAYVIENKIYKKMRIMCLTGAIADAIMVFAVLVKANVLGLGEWFSQNIWSAADTEYYEMRFSVHWQAFLLMFKYPFGGYDDKMFIRKFRNVYFAHNSWLDIAVSSGIIPFILILGLLILTVVTLVLLFRNSSSVNKYIILAGVSGMTLFHMFEPGVLYHVYWSLEVFMTGLVFGLYYNNSGKREIVLGKRDTVS